MRALNAKLLSLIMHKLLHGMQILIKNNPATMDKMKNQLDRIPCFSGTVLNTSNMSTYGSSGRVERNQSSM
jgi:hypothetical protein